MAVNFDAMLNNVRSVLRGEATGSLRFLAAVIAGLAVWSGVVIVSGWTTASKDSLSAEQGRFRTLLVLGNEYRTVRPSSSGSFSGNVDVATVFAQVSERMQLGSRVNRISPEGRNQAVEINRLYAEELAELQRQLATRGVRFIGLEVRALPAGDERLFSVSAIIGPMS